MKKNKIKRKKFIIVGVVTFFFILMYIFSTSKLDYLKIEKITHEIGFYLEKLLITKPELISDNIIQGINKELENEVNELKTMLELENSDYKFIHANVVKRDNNWYQELTIDKGEKDGIGIDMAVVSKNGLIGRVTKTTNSSSVIKLISASSDDTKISVTVKTNDDSIHGIIDDYLETEGLIQVNNISKNSTIELGNKVYTSGLGGIYPSGIYIGEVVSIEENNLGLNKVLKIKTDSSYDEIKFVSVVNRSTK